MKIQQASRQASLLRLQVAQGMDCSLHQALSQRIRDLRDCVFPHWRYRIPLRRSSGRAMVNSESFCLGSEKAASELVASTLPMPEWTCHCVKSANCKVQEGRC